MSEFVFANFYEIIKKYTNQKYSDLEFMYFLFGKVNKNKDDEKTELKINKSQVSRILKRTDDVPKRIRNFYCDSKNKVDLYDLFDEFLNDRFEECKEDELAEELQELYIDDQLLDTKIKDYLDGYCNDDFSTYFGEIFKEVLRRDNRLSSSAICIYSKGNTSVNLMVDDLMRIAFNDKYIPGKKIVVIPVNTTFDMVLTNPDEPIQHVSELTIHGKWIQKMSEKGKSSKNLKDLIQLSLQHKFSNNDGEYPVGAIAVIKYKDVYFYLLAISIFDEMGTAHSTIELFDSALEQLLSYYNSNGQGHPIYIPLMGTGMTRLNLTHSESYKIIKEKILSRIDKMSGNISIVIYTKDKEKMEDIFNGLQK